MYFWDKDSETFINVADNDKSVLISHTKAKSKWKKSLIILKLRNTNKHAPGKYPFTYAGFTGRQFVTKDKTANILCYKFLNDYQMKSEKWIKAQQFKLRHHKMCNFELLTVDYDPKKLVPKFKWKGAAKDDASDEAEDEDEAEGEDEKKGDKAKETAKPEDDAKSAKDAKKDKDAKKVSDPIKAEPKKEDKAKKGDFNAEYGLYVERPFYVVSKLSRGRYLDIVGNNIVIKNEDDKQSQQWVLSKTTWTITSVALKDQSWDLHFDGEGTKGELHVWKTNSQWFQKFKYEKGYFVNLKTKKVLEVQVGLDKDGQDVQVGKKSFTVNQKWNVIYVDEAANQASSGLSSAFGLHISRPFIIQSRMPMQRVLEVVGGRNIVANSLDRTKETQIFFLDTNSKTIKSVKYTGQSIDIQNAGASANLQIFTTNARWFQLFRYQDGYFVNIKDKRVFDITKGEDAEGQNVMVWKKHGSLNQQFDVRYIDQLKPELRRGDFFYEWGFYVSKEFFIKTKLGSSRYVTVIGDHMLVMMDRYGTKSQKWTFDKNSRTVKSVHNGMSLDIKNKGEGPAIQVWKTNSAWW